MIRKTVTAIVFVAALGASALSIAADSDRPMGRSMERQGMHEKPGMQDMEGMMGMMGACQGMMGGHTAGAGLMHQLPPGNEKIQLQVSAEMMQKAGKILAKYASQIK